MKKSALRKGRLISACCFCLFLCPVTLWAQVTNPSAWEQFINSPDNPLVIDTFRLQTFGDSPNDNWPYRLEGNAKAERFPEKYTDPFGGRSGIRMLSESSVRFEPYDPRFYQEVQGEVCYEGGNLRRNDTLNIRVYRQSGIAEPIISKPRTDNDICYRNQLSVSRTPYNIDLFMAKNSNYVSGFYLLEYALIYGKIAQYSLFSGQGNWMDTLRWSHLPPLRHRSALIDGEIILSDSIYCDKLSLKNGSKLHISPGGSLSAGQLLLHGNGVTFLNEGKVRIKGTTTLYKTFENKGKWYFISFPFDVYPSGIDARFSQQDASPNNGGNYFYVLTYNGEKRAKSGHPSGNWEVLPVQTGNRPLFEKNKGYLIALDEKAADQTISFSSPPGSIPEDFGKEALIAVTVQSDMTSGRADDQGWQLCGNPLPAPISLDQIMPNSDLDGYIYVHNGKSYNAYPIGSSSIILPSFGAFFIKAQKTTNIRISKKTRSLSAEQVEIPSLALSTDEEPIAAIATKNENRAVIQPEIHLAGDMLFLNNLPGKAHISIYDLSGKCLIRTAAETNKQLPFKEKNGVYILLLETSGHTRTFKLQKP